jgi:hypothetical protein
MSTINILFLISTLFLFLVYDIKIRTTLIFHGINPPHQFLEKYFNKKHTEDINIDTDLKANIIGKEEGVLYSPI